MRFSRLAVLFIATFLITDRGSAQGPTKTKAQLQTQVEFEIADHMRSYRIRGMSLAVIHNFEIDWAKGYGILDDATRKPVDTETLFQAGSISKAVTAVGAMSLIEQGRLSLDTDVNQHLESWKVPENQFTRTEKVTLRRIMSHTAGLTVHGFAGYAEGAKLPTIPQVLDGIKPANNAAVRVDVLPGTIARYSGGGTTVMQLVMTDVTNREFPDLMRELVLSKAGISHSTYAQPLPQVLRSNAASGYQDNGKPVEGKYHTYPEMAPAGLWTTASDLALFAIEIAKSRQGRANHILRQSTVELMTTVEKDEYGLGFQLTTRNGIQRFGHTGGTQGFRALVTCTFDGDGVAVMTNSDNGFQLANEIAAWVEDAYDWKRQTTATR
jgi:CubicO group peptidase (beta-lactamase class C family)